MQYVLLGITLFCVFVEFYINCIIIYSAVSCCVVCIETISEIQLTQEGAYEDVYDVHQ